MVKLIKPLFSDAATGVLHKTLAYRNGASTQSVAKLPAKIKTVSDAQASNRSKFQDGITAWKALSSAQIDAWAACNTGNITTFAYFMGNYMQDIVSPPC